MRFSSTYIPTLKESPSEAEVVSHKLLLRAGMVRKLTSGVYIYLPLGLKALENVQRVVREEMDAAGFSELLMPMVIPGDLWKETGRTGQFNDQYKKSTLRILDLFTVEQNHSKSPYYFRRINCPPTDTLTHDGHGAPVAVTGMTWSGFRPSDDACIYGYLIPSNMLASVVMDNLREIAQEVYKDQELAKEARDLSKEIREAVEKYAIVAGEVKDFYAYEVDGFGQYNVMDDANLPSLLSMPYIGYCDKENERYQNTREMVLSERNPYYFPGKVLTGIGSPHTDTRYVWSMSLCMQGITSDDKEEKEAIFKMLENSDGGTNLMHESIFADDDTKYTRPWFSWANSVFCEFVMDYLGYSVKLH